MIQLTEQEWQLVYRSLGQDDFFARVDAAIVLRTALAKYQEAKKEREEATKSNGAPPPSMDLEQEDVAGTSS